MHGDDLTALGGRSELEWYEAGLREAFEIKVKGHLGEAEDCAKEVRVLNRIVRVDQHGIYYEADPRHVEMLLKALPMDSTVSTPGVKDDTIDYDAVLEDLIGQDAMHDAVDPNASSENLPVAAIRKLKSKYVSFADCIDSHFDIPDCEQ